MEPRVLLVGTGKMDLTDNQVQRVQLAIGASRVKMVSWGLPDCQVTRDHRVAKEPLVFPVIKVLLENRVILDYLETRDHGDDQDPRDHKDFKESEEIGA